MQISVQLTRFWYVGLMGFTKIKAHFNLHTEKIFSSQLGLLSKHICYFSS